MKIDNGWGPVYVGVRFGEYFKNIYYLNPGEALSVNGVWVDTCVFSATASKGKTKYCLEGESALRDVVENVLKQIKARKAYHHDLLVVRTKGTLEEGDTEIAFWSDVLWVESSKLDNNKKEKTVAKISVSEIGKDAINPAHYTSGGIEVIDYLEAKLGVDGTVAYCLGNVIKYASRAGKKLHAAEDCRKASWYCLKAAELFDKKGAPREG